MKKGFTLIELAIVLVVIGLILGLSIKGIDLILSAKIKNDIANINKISSGIATYVSKYDSLPGSARGDTSIPSNNSGAAISDLIGEGILSEKDFRIEVAKPGSWAFMACEMDSQGNYIWSESDASMNYTCLTHASGGPMAFSNCQHACVVETGVDGWVEDYGKATGSQGLSRTGDVRSGNLMRQYRYLATLSYVPASAADCLRDVGTDASMSDLFGVRVW